MLAHNNTSLDLINYITSRFMNNVAFIEGWYRKISFKFFFCYLVTSSCCPLRLCSNRFLFVFTEKKCLSYIIKALNVPQLHILWFSNITLSLVSNAGHVIIILSEQHMVADLGISSFFRSSKHLVSVTSLG
jgi:hypothetical protein